MINFLYFLKTTKLTFVKKQHEAGDIYTFYFRSKRPVKYLAGQHGLFILPKFKGLHIFSLASSPDEKYIMVGTHVRAESEYKQRLAGLQSGDIMTMLGPVLNFVLPIKNQPVVLLAQGIGITPFRSMLVKNNKRLHTTLVHVDAADHTYRAETETLSDHAMYVSDPAAFTTAVNSVILQNDSALYYLSGSPRFVSATKQTLYTAGITKKQIKTDTFLGY